MRMIHCLSKGRRIPGFVRMLSVSSWAPGDKVQIISTGELGTVAANLRGGWWSVDVNSTKKRLRTRDITTVHKALTTKLIDETPIKSNATAASILTTPPKVSKKIAVPIPIVAPPETVADDLDSEHALHYDLKTIEPPLPHTRVQNWIIFSDLHVKSASIEICEEVLTRVHEAAVERSAGVIFLGDFWHVRGALNVDLLNRILVQLNKWVQPVIMIPGNHDQVTLGGAIHALEPLKYAFRSDQILMVSEPVVCMGALWVPYRRDHRLLRGILTAGAKNPQVRVVYCHADVKGASMNDGMKSREGMEIHMFPPHMPIYSGHYHKPHTITRGDTSLHYVGSPYQTSLSEANEKKYLYCMNNTRDPVSGVYSWTETERWGIDIGPKYFKTKSVDDAVFASVKAGDKVVLSIKEGDDVFDLVSSMKDKKVELELREEKLPVRGEETSVSLQSSSVSAVDSADMNPKQAFFEFMRINSTTNGTSELLATADEALRDAIIKEGLDTIDRLSNSVNASSNKITDGSNTYNLALDRIELSGFGPYANKVKYPLSKRGLVLIRGKSNDATGADSNGAGKTTLAMSVLWALTGTLDTRLVTDGKAADVAHDCSMSKGSKADKTKAKGAEVALFGSINGKDFVIVRKRSSKKSELIFTVGGVELTQQSTKDTQALIDEKLGVGDGLLQRCCFFGQHSHTMQALLGLTDIRLKNELSLLVDTTIWTSAVDDVKLREKAAKLRMQEIAVELRIRGEEVKKESNALETSRLTLSKLQQEARVIESSIQAIAMKNGTSTTPVLTAEEVAKNITRLETEATEYRQTVLDVLKQQNEEANSQEAALSFSFEMELQRITEAKSQLQYVLQTSQSNVGSLGSKQKQLKTQIDTANVTIVNLLKGFDVSVLADRSSVGLKKHVAGYKDAVQSTNMKLAECEIKIASAKESLGNLLVFRAKCEKGGHGGSASAEACPTCGQELQAESAASRSAALNASVTALAEEKVILSKACNSARVSNEALQKAILLTEQLESATEKLEQLQGELAAEEKVLKKKQEEMVEVESRLAAKKAEQKAAEQLKSKDKSARTEGLRQANTHLSTLLQELERLKTMIIPLRRAESDVTLLLNKKKQELAVMQERITVGTATVATQEANTAAIQTQIDTLHAEREAAHRLMTILNKVAELFGARGVQHYVFMVVIKILEGIANLYLEVLADGGIQLRLTEDEEGDKIVKGVVIRGADGEFRERGLSQLSGGQWRRVSLALDLAFAEVIRRRGILRCNMIVMDEILTHLDASGREAVGSVLRALVQGPVSDMEAEDAHSNMEVFNKLLGAGAYETVIIILQDLAAQELEEAFDHIDTVMKEADSSVVIVDGA